MNKVLIAMMIIVFVLGVTAFIVSRRSDEPTTPAPTISVSPTEIPASSAKLKKYNDSSGFSFQYPENLILTPKIPLPNNAYAIVELTSPAEDSVITIKVEDSNLTSIKKAVTADTSTDIKLADLNAAQFEDDNKKTTVALDQGVLFTIILSPINSKESWTTAYNNIVSSFAFTEPAGNTSSAIDTGSSTGGEDDIVFEGEETVE